MHFKKQLKIPNENYQNASSVSEVLNLQYCGEVVQEEEEKTGRGIARDIRVTGVGGMVDELGGGGETGGAS